VLILLVLPLLIDRFSSRLQPNWAKRPREKATKAKKERRCRHDASPDERRTQGRAADRDRHARAGRPGQGRSAATAHTGGQRARQCAGHADRAPGRHRAGGPSGRGGGGEWWKAFGSRALDGLVAQALAANNDIQVAQATLKQASELTRVARGGLFPQIDAGYQASRQRVGNVLSSPLPTQTPSLFTLHTAQVNLTYTLDLFGETRSRIRSAQAATRAQQARLAG
jgi:outer membrane protein TolC